MSVRSAGVLVDATQMSPLACGRCHGDYACRMRSPCRPYRPYRPYMILSSPVPCSLNSVT